MMIETLVAMSRYLSARHDDDLADRMNYLYTPNLLLVEYLNWTIKFVLISFKQFGGRPLECMFPNKFPGSWEQVPPDVHVSLIEENQRYSTERRMSYYQWVPFFLLLQAACFRLPSILWRCFSLSSGIRVHDIVKRAIDSKNMEEENRQRSLNVLASYIARTLHFQHIIANRSLVVHKIMRFLNVTYSACFISYMYLATKIIYIFNILVQIYAMNKFLETDKRQWYGLSVINDLIHGIPWERSGNFPRESLCDFTVRQVGVMVINIFNEKIFILLWFWYSILLVASVVSLIYWLFCILIPYFARSYITQTLELYEDKDLNISKRRGEIKTFVNECLKQDGVFTLRMVGLHAGIVFNSELVMRLYRTYSHIVDKNSNSSIESGKVNHQLLDGKTLSDSHSSINNVKKRYEKGSSTEDIDLLMHLIPTSRSPGNKSPNTSDERKNDYQLDFAGN